MKTDLEKLFESNWDNIKKNLQEEWGKLTDQDVKQIDGSYDFFIGKLKKLYKYSKDEIEEALDEFFASEGIEDISGKTKQLLGTVKENSLSLKHTLEDYTRKYWDSLKDKSIEVEENIVAYVKENPVKVLGMAAIAGFAISKIFSARQ